MTPTYENNLLESFEATNNEPIRQVHKIDWENNRLLTQTLSNLEAVDQNIKVITSVEYQEHQAMPDWFGLAMKDMYGMPMAFVKANMERLIKEALSAYVKIEKLSDFEIKDLDKYSLLVTFTVTLEDGQSFIESLVVNTNV